MASQIKVAGLLYCELVCIGRIGNCKKIFVGDSNHDGGMCPRGQMSWMSPSNVAQCRLASSTVQSHRGKDRYH